MITAAQSRRGGIKTCGAPRLEATPADLIGDRRNAMLLRIFGQLVAATREDLFYVNKIVPFVNVVMKSEVPAHVRGGKVQAPTQSWKK